jgi:hypothetical protein
MSQDHLRNLEENHLSSNIFDDIICALKSRDKAGFSRGSFDEIIWHIIQ